MSHTVQAQAQPHAWYAMRQFLSLIWLHFISLCCCCSHWMPGKNGNGLVAVCLPSVLQGGIFGENAPLIRLFRCASYDDGCGIRSVPDFLPSRLIRFRFVAIPFLDCDPGIDKNAFAALYDHGSGVDWFSRGAFSGVFGRARYGFWLFQTFNFDHLLTLTCVLAASFPPPPQPVIDTRQAGVVAAGLSLILTCSVTTGEDVSVTLAWHFPTFGVCFYALCVKDLKNFILNKHYDEKEFENVAVRFFWNFNQSINQSIHLSF